jgi:hypothetical protein
VARSENQRGDAGRDEGPLKRCCLRAVSQPAREGGLSQTTATCVSIAKSRCAQCEWWSSINAAVSMLQAAVLGALDWADVEHVAAWIVAAAVFEIG